MTTWKTHKKRRLGVWYEWFAWHPVLVDASTQEKHYERTWVWWQQIWRMKVYNWEGALICKYSIGNPKTV